MRWSVRQLPFGWRLNRVALVGLPIAFVQPAGVWALLLSMRRRRTSPLGSEWSNNSDGHALPSVQFGEKKKLRGISPERAELLGLISLSCGNLHTMDNPIGSQETSLDRGVRHFWGFLQQYGFLVIFVVIAGLYAKSKYEEVQCKEAVKKLNSE